MKSLQLGKGHFHRGRQIIGLFSSRTVPSCDQKSAFSYNNNGNSGPFSGWGVTVQFYSRRTSQVLETTKDPAWSVLFDLLTDPEPYILCLASIIPGTKQPETIPVAGTTHTSPSQTARLACLSFPVQTLLEAVAHASPSPLCPAYAHPGASPIPSVWHAVCLRSQRPVSTVKFIFS